MRSPRLCEGLVVGLCLFLAGCAHHPDDAPRPKNGIAEYGELTVQSLGVMGATMDALARVDGEKERASPEVVGTFSDCVDRLRIQSMQVWSRAQAIRVRGDAYFENWRENLALIKDPAVRELAGRHRAELRERFEKVKAGSQQTREDFQPFMVGLRKLRADLEDDPGVVASEAGKNLVVHLREKGERVKSGLTGIRAELESMTALITPDKAPQKTSP
jgi:hypothetical protein